MPESPDRHPPAAAPESDRDVVARIASEHLTPDDARTWLALARPAIRLARARSDEAPVAVLGGTPNLAADQEWPAWEGVGPLTFIGEVDLAAVARFPLDITLPADGRLLFFYFDGSYDDGAGSASTVGYWDPVSLAGARTIHVPAGTPSQPRPAPAKVHVLPQVPFAGHEVVTFPGFEHVGLRAAFDATDMDLMEWIEHPVSGDAFIDAVAGRHGGPQHQIGGYASSIQAPVEMEAAWGVLGGDATAVDPAEAATEAARWRPLLQVDSDDDLGAMWGDGGTLYWLARSEDLDAVDLTQTTFTWQCG